MADIEEPHDSLCDRALAALEHFVGQHHARASEPCDDAARTYADEGELREAATHLTRALELGDAGQSSAEDVADLRCVRAKVELLRGRWDGAEADAEMALAALTGLIDDTYLASAVAFNGKNNNRSGTWDSAPYDAHFLVLETKRAVARLLLSQAMRAQGKLGPPTESLLRDALTSFESLARAVPTNGTATAAAAAAAAVSNEATARAALGTYCMHVGRLPEAEDHHRAALAMRERACTGRNRSDVGASLEGLAAVLYRQAEHAGAGGKQEEADGCLFRALHVFKATLGDNCKEVLKLQPYVRALRHHWSDGDGDGGGGGGGDVVARECGGDPYPHV